MLDVESFKKLPITLMRGLTWELGSRNGDSKDKLVEMWQRKYEYAQSLQAEINENAPAPAAIHSNQAPNIQHPTPLTDQSTLRLHRALQLSSVSVTTMECLALLKYPIQYQVRVESDNVGKILKPLLTCITIYINIQFETIENFMKDLAKLLNDNNLPSTIVEQFFQLGNVDVALLAYHIKSEAFITKELEKDVKQEINILSDAIHYYWASLLRGASLDSDLLWPDDYTATEQHKLRSFVKAKLQMISEPLDTSQSRINATLAIRTVRNPPVDKPFNNMVVMAIIKEVQEDSLEEIPRKRPKMHEESATIPSGK